MPIVPPHSHREFRAAAPARIGWYPYIYRGTDVSVDPGPGGWTVEVGGGGVRTLAFSKTDENGEPRAVTLLQAGDTITVTDDPDTPPVTGWVRYVLTADPVDNGTWATATALRTDTIGSTNPPPLGSVVRVYTTWSASGPALDARYVKQAGDSMTGNLDARGLQVGNVWGGTWLGLQNGSPIPDSSPSLLLGTPGGSGATYLIGAPGSQVNIRPAAGTSVDYQFQTTGLWLPAAPTGTGHATRKDYVDSQVGTRMLRDSQSITDWNSPTTNQFLMASGAANGPSSTKTGWWYGWQVVHNSSWITQFALPFAQNGIDGNVLSIRHKENGVWGSWNRLINYGNLSWDTLDNFVFIRHGGNSASATSSAQSVWAIGNKKDSGSAAITTNEQFRIQRYNTSGSYVSSPMTIAASTGAVSFPNGHSRALHAMDDSTPVPADQAATVGVVARMIFDALDALNLLTPQARNLGPEGLTNLIIGPASPEYDEAEAVYPA